MSSDVLLNDAGVETGGCWTWSAVRRARADRGRVERVKDKVMKGPRADAMAGADLSQVVWNFRSGEDRAIEQDDAAGRHYYYTGQSTPTGSWRSSIPDDFGIGRLSGRYPGPL